MTNQEAFEAARAGDWIAESFTRSGDVFTLGGKSAGYSSFADCLTDGQSIFYAAFDEDDNREAGLAIWDASAKTLTPVEVHATLVGGAFIKGDPGPLQFTKGGTITGTFNATAFNAMWSHVWEKGNPHETEAKDIDQDNTNLLGDTVQDALDKVADFILTGDIDGGIDIDIGDLDGSLAEDIVLQSRKDAQKVVSDFSFEKDGDNPLTMKDTGMYAGTEYVRNKSNVWEVDPSLSVTNDISAGGNLSVEGTTELKGDLTLEGGDLIFNGGGIEGDLSVNGNITIEGGGAIIDGGGNPIGGGNLEDAPDDGQLYGRQSKAWAVVTSGGASSWNDLTDKPDEFPPSDHTHEIDDVNGLQDALDAAGGAPTWDDVTGKPSEFPPSSHTHDYIGEAPKDGELYVRKDGAWEKFTPSSGSGGGEFMVPVQQPVTAGECTYGPRGDGGSGLFSEGSWYVQKSGGGPGTLTVPAGFKFVLYNITANNKAVRHDSIIIDGVQVYKQDSDMGKTQRTCDSNNYFYDVEPKFIAENSVKFNTTSGSNNWFHFFGFFIAADNTRESAELRATYLAEEAERIAAMPTPDPEPEVGTQEIPE